MILLATLLLATVAAAAPAPTQAEGLPANDGWVTDLAGLLTPGQERSLEALMESYRAGSGQDVAVLTVPDLGGRALEELALDVARDWKIGDEETSAGALLLVAQAERKIRIEVGRGLEGELTDSICGRIIRDVISPRFKAGDFHGGLREGLLAIHDAAGGDYGRLPERRRGRHSGGTAGLSVFAVVMIFVVLSAVLRGRRGGGGGRGGLGGILPWLILSQMSSGRPRGFHGGGGGFSGFGGGGFGGGGGFSGFGGGGGFSGGGASGGW